MSMIRFAEQTELNNLFAKYLEAYHQSNPQRKTWGLFNDFQIIQAEDGAGVFLSPEATLFGDKRKRQEDSALAKNIVTRILDSAAYFLARNIPIENVPDELRICLAVCHDNVHWTGVIATVGSFKETYKKLLEFRDRDNTIFQTNSSRSETALHNDAKYVIYNWLGIILEHPNQSQITSLDDRTKILLDFFQRSDMRVEHLDSMNSSVYHERIEDSLLQIKRKIDLNSKLCSQQQGNTCGDHTAINLFMTSMLGVVPLLNSGSNGITSEHLREFTDAIRTLAPDYSANKVLEFIKSPRGIGKGLVSPISIAVSEIEQITIDMILELKKMVERATSVLVNEAQKEIIDMNVITDNTPADSMKKEKERIIEIVTKLSDIFKGKYKLTQKIDAIDKPVLGVLAKLIANDICSEIDHYYLRNEKSPEALSEQEKTFNSYKNWKESPELAKQKQVRGVALLDKFKNEKLLAIDNVPEKFKKDYQDAIINFHKNSVAVWLSDKTDEQKLESLKSEASTQFKHQHNGKRLLADALMMIGCLFLGLGAVVGFYRLSKGKTFFFQGNSTVKKLQNDVIDKLVFK